MRRTLILLALPAALLIGHAPLCAQLRPESPATAPAEKKAPARDARIIVDTLPGAEVYLDDVFQGRASSAGRVAIANAKSGEHALRVTLEGKKEYASRVTVTPGKDASVHVDLQDLPARLAVHAVPGAEVFVDDASRGTADSSGELLLTDLSAGSHTVRVSARGKAEFKQQLSLTAGKEASVNAALADLPGRILVHSSPAADVFVDESRRGSTDSAGEFTAAEIPAGSHSLRVSARGKKDFQAQLTVPAGKDESVQAPLTDLAGRIIVHSSPGADVLVDDVRRGTTDSSGDLVVADVAPGAHDLRVWAAGKRNYQQLVSVGAAQETRIDASLASIEPAAAPAPPPVHNYRVMAKLGMLVYVTGSLTINSTTAVFHSDNGKTSFEFALADVERAYETLGDLGSRHDLHVVLKSGGRYEMINGPGAGHGVAGAQFVSQVMGLVTGNAPVSAKK